MVCHEMEHLQGLDMTHWSVSEGSIKIDENFEKENESYQQEINNYQSKIAQFKKDDPSAFDRDKYMKDYIEKEGTKWKKLDEHVPQPPPFYGKREQFNIDYALDMFKAAQKDKQKVELKQKYFNEKTKQGVKVTEDDFNRDFGHK
jgi:hypothetical protein